MYLQNISVIFADLIRDIKDPEHPHTLEELNIVREDSISVQHCRATVTTRQTDKDGCNMASSTSDEGDDELWIKIEFTPTVSHCSLATLIGLCLRVKLERCLQSPFKLDISVSEGTHAIEGDVNKQINDKERVAAAMENPALRDMVEECIRVVEY